MPFAEHLSELLPVDLPHRASLIDLASRHLELISEANRSFNLTRIVDPREAAIKHVLDSVLPWRLFAGAGHVLDAGTGAGYPGIPLAVVLPDVQFTLCESVGKKARFLESAVASLGLPEVEVSGLRAEDWLRSRRARVITARAVAPLLRMLDLFGPAITQGARALLYKGPDVESEIEGARTELRRKNIEARIVERFELPDRLGSRTLVELSGVPPAT